MTNKPNKVNVSNTPSVPNKTSYATEKRFKILEFLKQNSDQDVTTKDIQSYMESIDEKVNLTTIYRYLDKLEEEGQLLKRPSDKGKTCAFQYINPDSTCQNHLHLKCKNCKKIIHLDCGFMKQLEQHIYNHHHFALECNTSMLFGLCESCN